MKALQNICLLIVALFVLGCHSSNDLILEGQRIPFLSSAIPEVVTILDNADPVKESHHRIIWKVDKSTGITIDQIIEQGLLNNFGGLILKGYDLNEYLSIRSVLDTISSYPLFYGTEEVMLLNKQFADAKESASAVMIAAQKNPVQLNALEDQFRLQQDIFGFNFSASIYNHKYDIDDINWEKAYDFQDGDPTFYLDRIIDLNDNKALSVLKTFDQEIMASIDSTTNIDSIYHHTRSLISAGLSSIIIDSTLINEPQTDVRHFFKNILGFQGILASEVSHFGQFDLAFESGVDLFIVDNPNINRFNDRLKFSLDETLLNSEELESLHKILFAKFWMKDKFEPIQGSYDPWMTVTGIQQIEKESSVLVNNYKNLLPFTHTYKRDFRLLCYGPSTLDSMEQVINLFADYKRNFYNTSTSQELTTLSPARYRFATIIVTLESINLNSIKDSLFIQFINDISATRKVALINFGNPTNLIHFDTTVTQLQFFKRSGHTEDLAAHILFGGDIARGRIPVDLSDKLKKGQQIKTEKTRWQFANADNIGVDQEELNKIEVIAKEGIRRRAFPGCQIFVVKDNNVIYNKSFGNHTYNRKKSQPVQKSDIYDIASVTKVAASSLAMMELFENGKYKLKDKLNKHISIENTKQIGKVKMQDLLIHRSGIQSYMPLGFIIQHKDEIESKFGRYRADTVHSDYPIKVAKNVFYSKIMLDSLWEHVVNLSADKKKYVYSDVNMFLIQKMIEEKTGKPLDEFVFKNFYKQLGLRNTSYVPLKTFTKDRIVPTEKDMQWRGQLLDGYVHDPTAALLGGVSGNAGLFSNAHDLAVIGQMLLNGGTYGGRKYFDKETVDLFTSAKFAPNRGLGFDSNNDGSAKVGDLASRDTYGHLGFTGTALWIDPAENLVYVFLSNRVHPLQNNNKLIKYRYRQRIHDTIYKAIMKGKEGVESISVDRAVAGVEN